MRKYLLRLHEMRRSHQRRMACAEKHIADSRFHVRESSRYGRKVGSVEYEDAARHHAVAGWKSVTDAIEQVTRCGCPRELWPSAVDDRIGGVAGGA